jgi:ABC-2 type transport system permease protein
MAFAVALMAELLAAPFIDVLAALGGARWLGAYAVVAAIGFVATAAAVALTVGLFRTIGPKRTRLVAQIVAAVIGAAFVIGLQLAAILSNDTLSRIEVLGSDAIVTVAPAVGSLAYWPARAMLGDAAALAAVLGASVLLLGAAIIAFAPRFGAHVTAAAGVSHAAVRQHRSSERFRPATPRRALRHKEWTLLTRDPWLVSQTLMQILYLLPPAFLLWHSFGEGTGAILVLVPVVVMSAGQLAGGLAWLAISGEDAPDLIASAPVPKRQIVHAKIEAVMGGIAIVFLPFVAGLAFLSLWHALVAAIGVVVAAASATAVQLWFRTQAKRTQFRRRQISSRIATFAEAFSSISWAGTAVLAAAGIWLAVAAGLVAVGVLIGAWLISPQRGEAPRRRLRRRVAVTPAA